MAAKRGRGSVTRRKDGIYQGQVSLGYDQDGKRNRPTVYGHTVQEVEEKIAELRRKAKQGEIRKASPLTVRAFLEGWLQSRRTRKTNKQYRESTADLYNGLLKNHILPHLGEKYLDRLKWQDVDVFYRRLREQGASDSTVRKVHVLLLAAMSDAAKADKIVRNPMDHVDSPMYKPPEMQTLTPKEGEKLLTAATEDNLYALYLLALDTGMRQGEIFGLKRADLDLKNRTVAVRRSIRYANDGRLLVTATKTGKERNVPISQRAAAAMREHLKRTMSAEWVFSDKSGLPLRKENFARRSWRPTLKRAGLSITFHGLRHSCATRLLSQGVHPKIVSERLGHSSVQVTLDTYSHAIPALGREAADKFDEVSSSE